VEELQAAFESCALVDRSRLCRLRATGPDMLDLLHRLSTGDVASLETGGCTQTVVTTPKGRIVERLFVQHLGDDGVWMIGGRGSGERTAAHLARYTFREDTGLADLTDETTQLAVLGPRSGDVLASLGDTAHRVLRGNGLSTEGFSIVVRREREAQLRQELAAAVERCGGRPCGDDAAEAWRLLRGLPAAGHELTEEYNPLEAGLWDAVSFDKGCYVGQEVVARLRTYDKVSRTLIGLRLDALHELPEPGTALLVEDRKVGTLTSAVHPPGEDHPVALGYVKRKELRPGLTLRVGDPGSASIAVPVGLPFR
jgi:folate-binding protein YgfZ